MGDYRLTGRLGSGSQGVVYLATAPNGRPVALKVLRDDLLGEHGHLRRLAKEIRAARKVAPFCTAQVLAADLRADFPHIASEYIEGPSLSEKIAQDGPLYGGDLEQLAVSMATALTAIHDAGIVHRDFKPANILLGPYGPRVIDFGIARVLEGTTGTTSGVIGTPAYMAPEQIKAQRLTPAVDVFAWACVVAFAATGRPPFGSDSIAAIFHRILNEEPELTGVAGVLREIVISCLNKDPARRPTAREVQALLASGQKPEAAPISAKRRRGLLRMAERLAWWLAISGLLAASLVHDSWRLRLVALALWSLWQPVLTRTRCKARLADGGICALPVRGRAFACSEPHQRQKKNALRRLFPRPAARRPPVTPQISRDWLLHDVPVLVAAGLGTVAALAGMVWGLFN